MDNKAENKYLSDIFSTLRSLLAGVPDGINVDIKRLTDNTFSTELTSELTKTLEKSTAELSQALASMVESLKGKDVTFGEMRLNGFDVTINKHKTSGAENGEFVDLSRTQMHKGYIHHGAVATPIVDAIDGAVKTARNIIKPDFGKSTSKDYSTYNSASEKNNAVNILKNDHFILSWNERGERQVYFMRYTGDNYRDFRKYFSIRTNNLWSEDSLCEGKMYFVNMSEVEKNLHEIEDYQLRSFLINFPYCPNWDYSGRAIVNWQKIWFTDSNSASVYLKSHYGNRIFNKDEPLISYSWSGAKEFIQYTQEKPKGEECIKLPNSDRWFAINNDNLENLPYKVIIKKEGNNINFGYDLVSHADIIVDLIYDINYNYNLRHQDSGKVVFEPSWEDVKRYRTLRRDCQSWSDFKAFLQVLYAYIYESTTRNNNMREGLPKNLRNHEFVNTVSTLRNYYTAHSVAGYKNHGKTAINIILQNYLGETDEPRTAEDFRILQMRLLTSFEQFLHECDREVRESNPLVIGPVIFENENVYCKTYRHKIRLPRILKNFDNLQNTDCYCTFKNHVDLKEATNPIICLVSGEEPQGVIQNNSDEVFISSHRFNNIKLPKICKEFSGCMVTVFAITPLTMSASELSVFKAKTFVITDQVTQRPCFARGLVRMDRGGNFYCGNILLSERKYKDKIIEIDDFYKESSNSTYAFQATPEGTKLISAIDF